MELPLTIGVSMWSLLLLRAIWLAPAYGRDVLAFLRDLDDYRLTRPRFPLRNKRRPSDDCIGRADRGRHRARGSQAVARGETRSGSTLPLVKPSRALARRPLRPSRLPLRRVRFTPASNLQRDKVRGEHCAACGRDRSVDPAHLVPRSAGGCDHPDCVVPLCRRCHRAFDDGALDLLAHLEPRYRRELAHALLHVALAELVRRVTARRAPLRDAA
jgi:hypothetical protein